ncbi:RNA 2',3'-cyclic phosphodiesterase [Desulforegula conservatrix]|uniref:RNA 2',3'-cyclic phosphodiesterase n=1 Tax=Desulforegula conservatrix TaxID=153026 RepID=UPI0003FAC5ED|nr:RNA 2',3'-cyclic phosphodiesterase [Desulforegula conservatrix]
MTDKPRLFIALDIPDTAVEKVMDIQKMMKKANIPARWVSTKNIHLTLKFIGETDSKNLPCIKEILEYSVNDFEPFKLSISNAGAFPGMINPSVIWAGLTGETELVMKLSRIIDRNLFEKLDIKRETKSSKPHITIARIKTRINPSKLAGVIEEIGSNTPFPFIAESVSLFQSTLTRDGAKYTALKTLKLNTKNH